MVDSYLQTLLIIFFIIFVHNYLKQFRQKTYFPTNWPVIGMIPALIQNAYRIHDFATEILKKSGGTFKLCGGCFHNIDMVITGDPANVHHILSKNFHNYPKGPEFRMIFDILGDGIFNTDSELWEIHRKVTMSLLNHGNFYKLLERTVWQKVEKGLLPLLDNFAEKGVSFDLQDIFQRFTFDSISNLVLDYDPGSLSIELPEIPCEKAFNDVVEALLHRHIMPEGYWKLQKWLKIGMEKKLILAWDAFDQYIYRCIDLKQVKLREKSDSSVTKERSDFITAFIEAYEGQNTAICSGARVFLRDTMLNLLLAGRDTTSTALTWLFWLLATHPLIKAKVHEEIETKLDVKDGQKMRCFTVEESRNLIYLHGAICEALRLFPPVALEHKSPRHADVLPSGIEINPNTKVILSFYSMGRMESIWGKDCNEFDPERWISERGRIKHEPSYKFPAFNAGPRTCLGKEMSFVQMKMVAATIIHNYHIHVVEGHPIAPKDSIILQMKDGLMVRISKRV